MYVLHLSDDMIKIVDGVATSKKISVRNLYAVAMPNDYLMSPEDKSYTDIANLISEGLMEINSKTKKVRLVLESSTIPFTEYILPRLPFAKMLEMIKNEIFSDEKLSRTNTVDYVEVERNVNNTKQSRVFVTYISNEIIKHAERFFKTSGLKLETIDVAQNAVSKLCAKMKNLPNNFVLADYKDSAITMYLFINKKHKFSFTKNMMAMPSMQFQNERDYFIKETSAIFKESLEFFARKFEDSELFEIDEVFLTGNVEQIEVCLPSVNERLGREIKIFEKPDFIDSLNQQEFNLFTTALGAYIREEKLL